MEQLYKQDADDALVAYFTKYKDQLQCEDVSKHLPDPVVNDRTRMMFTHLYSYIQKDKLVLIDVCNSIFGSSMMAQLTELLDGDLPLNPWEILGRSPRQKHLDSDFPTPEKAKEKWKPIVKSYIKQGKLDLLSMTVQRLAYVMVDDDLAGTFVKEQAANAIDFLEEIPEECLTYLLNRVFKNNKNNSRVKTWWQTEMITRRTATGGTKSVLVERIQRVTASAREASKKALQAPSQKYIYLGKNQ